MPRISPHLVTDQLGDVLEGGGVPQLDAAVRRRRGENPTSDGPTRYELVVGTHAAAQNVVVVGSNHGSRLDGGAGG